MNPTIAQAVAEARIADLHREGASRRRSRRMAARPSVWIAIRSRWSAVRRAFATRVAALKPAPAPTDTACCAA